LNYPDAPKPQYYRDPIRDKMSPVFRSDSPEFAELSEERVAIMGEGGQLDEAALRPAAFESTLERMRLNAEHDITLLDQEIMRLDEESAAYEARMIERGLDPDLLYHL
jgi:hypothetical protein